MKLRKNFVSNSSSASFVLRVSSINLYNKPIDVIKWFRNDLPKIVDKIVEASNLYSYEEEKEEISKNIEALIENHRKQQKTQMSAGNYFLLQVSINEYSPRLTIESFKTLEDIQTHEKAIRNE